jgi:predicted nucleic acid-binding protein
MIVFANASHHEVAKTWLAEFPNLKLTYADSVSFAIMQESGCKDFLSFDSHFLSAGFRRWTGS